jgi:hypothetical protein
VAALSATTSRAQITIHAERSCATCFIELVRVTTLGQQSDSALLSERAVPVRDSHGRFYAWSVELGQIAVYDTLGRQTSTIGRRGGGPGEFERNAGALVIGRGDTLFVQQGRTLSAFAPNGKFVRQIALPGGIFGNALGLGDGNFIIPTPISTPARVGLPLHLLSPTGEVVRSFGAVIADYDESCMSCAARRIARSRTPGNLWSARTETYAIEEWTTAGKRVQSIQVLGSEWLSEATSARLRQSGVRPNPTFPVLAGVHEDSATHLWVFGTRSNQQIVFPNPGSTPPGVARQPNSAAGSVERVSQIDVLDLGTRTMLASLRVDSLLLMPIGGGLLFSRRSDSAGYVVIDIWRVRLRNDVRRIRLPALPRIEHGVRLFQKPRR